MSLNENIYTYNHYRVFLKDLIKSYPGNGWGIPRQIALIGNFHPSLVSHVLSAKKDFSLEQGDAVASFFQLSSDETDYFLLLINHERAGTANLKNRFLNQIQSMKEQKLELSSRLEGETELEMVDKQRFYSGVIYSAVRLTLTLPNVDSIEALAQYTQISILEANEIINFLLSSKLVVKNGDWYKLGPSITHLESQSPLISTLHRNLRLETMVRHGKSCKDDFSFSALLTLSKKEFDELKEELRQWVTKLGKTVEESTPEELYIFTLDWMKY